MRKTLAVLASVLLGLAACEVYLRLVEPELLPKAELYRIDPEIGKRMRPGWRGEEFGTRIEINSLGLRNPEVPYERPPGTFRILALGDSWTFGFRMQEPNAYPRQLERRLNERMQRRADPRRVQVINAGVVGYSTGQEAAYFSAEGRKFQPDLVVVAFYPVNDLHLKREKYERYQALHRIHPWLLDAYLFPQELRLRAFWVGVRRALKQRAAEARLAVAKRLEYKDAGARAIVEDDWTADYRADAAGWKSARAGLSEVGATASAIGAAGLVVLLPDVLDLARYLDRYHPKIEPMLRSAVEQVGLDWFDLRATFEPHRDAVEAIRLEGTRHPNARGYALIAEAVAEEIERRYLAAPKPR